LQIEIKKISLKEAMKIFKTYHLLLLLPLFAISCKEPLQRNEITPVGEHFIIKNKVYKIIGNEVKIIADIANDSIKRFSMSKPEALSLGNQAFKIGNETAYSDLKLAFRNNYLYYKITLSAKTDIRNKISSGTFTLRIYDAFGFPIFSNNIPTGDFSDLEYMGKTVITYEDFNSIDKYTFSSNVLTKPNKNNSKDNFWEGFYKP